MCALKLKGAVTDGRKPLITVAPRRLRDLTRRRLQRPVIRSKAAAYGLAFGRGFRSNPTPPFLQPKDLCCCSQRKLLLTTEREFACGSGRAATCCSTVVYGRLLCRPQRPNSRPLPDLHGSTTIAADEQALPTLVHSPARKSATVWTNNPPAFSLSFIRNPKSRLSPVSSTLALQAWAAR